MDGEDWGEPAVLEIESFLAKDYRHIKIIWGAILS